MVAPPALVPTPEIFGAPELTRDTKPLKISRFSRSLIGAHGRNDLEPVASGPYLGAEKALLALNQAARQVLGRTGPGKKAAAAATAASASALAANDNPPPAAAVSTKLNLKPKAPVPASLQSVVSAAPPLSSSTPQPPQPDDTARVSQALVLKLMNLGDDATRARELRNHIAPVAENNHTVIVPPSELLKAIAHHAQRCKSTTSTTTDQSSPSPLDALRQVAIIARLVILKLYGTGSPELSQFEDGLRPAFS